MIKILAKFTNENKDYILYTNDNKTIIPAYLKSGKISPITDPKDLEFARQVFLELQNDKHDKEDFIELVPIYHNGIKYKRLYDKYNKKQYFYDDQGEAKGEALEYLNNLYNKDIDIFYSGNDNKEHSNKKKKKKKLIKIGSLSVLVLLLGTQLFNNLSEFTFSSSNQDYLNYSYEDENSAAIVMSYLDNNYKISNEDKEFFKTIEPYFKENEEYFDMSMVKRNLTDLKINYDESEIDKYNGYYQSSEDKIVICTSDHMDNSLKTQKTLLHELTHAISNTGYGGENLALTEGLTEMMSCEYLEVYTNDYPKEQTYARIMCELVGQENVRKSFFQGDIDMLAESLSKNCGTKDDALKFLSLIEDESINVKITKESNIKQDVIDANKTLDEIRPMIDNYIKTYYESKTNSKLEENDLMQAYMDSLRNTNNFNNHEDTIHMHVVKSYFNSKLNDSNNVAIDYFTKTSNELFTEEYEINNGMLTPRENERVK